MRAERDELLELKGWLAHTHAKPEDPGEAPTLLSAEEVEEELEQARRYEQAQKELARLPEPPVDPDTINIDDWELREQIRRNYPVTMSAEAIAKADADHELAKKFERHDHLVAKLQDLVDVGTHTCPECEHQWPVESDRVEKVKAELDAIDLAGLERPSKPDMANVELARRQLQAFDKVRDDWDRVKDTPKPEFTRQQLAKMQDAKERRPELEAVTPALAGVKELNALYRERLAYDQKAATYSDDLTNYEIWLEEHSEKSARAEELAAFHDLQKLEAEYEQARIFEDRMEAYEKALGAYEGRKAEIDQRRAQEEGYRKGKEALTILRKLVKQHLIPSLNKVASHYLSKMTGGQRNLVEVNEEFEIQVDGQPINTLSGSGKAVANLALRLGLGQVLTNNQFSVFLGDEIDASMDADRAENTALTLVYLAERISQILLVTHKYPQADYYIELENGQADAG